MMRHLYRATLLGLLLCCASGLALPGCDKGASEQAEGRDWRPVVEQIDEALVRAVLAEQGWTVSDEPPMTMTMTAEDVRSMGGQAEGDTHVLIVSAKKGEHTASVSLTTYPGDVKPARGDRGISLGAPMLAAGDKGVSTSVMDAELEDDPDAANALLDALIAAAEARAGE